ncbi:glucosaminidase domain-containing protein [Aureispira anguillae]|uniref:Peptidoglycan hydrolase n=1 Tax=Aureispira anguillae TaxID=2864201 RepID=A0A915YLR0_9BACT|nr:glucosaminidase domain-containing protein [Aureispira anguillae]BDS15256.1 glucosaminidase domain-containing protein [Aureispira anguillae]
MRGIIVILLGVLTFQTHSILAAPLLENFYIDDVKARIYIEKYKHIAVAEMDRTGIPASIKMAQGILESGVGESELASVANNHFGIKCGGEVWQGETHYVWDDEVVKSCFRVYESAEESYIAHSEFLLNPKKAFRYGVLFELDKEDYKAWAKGLQKSGYATSKTYAKNLISIIERLELYKLDYLTVEVLALTEGALADIFPSMGPDVDRSADDTTTKTTRIPDPFSAVTDSVDMVLTLYVFKINGIAAVYVQPGDNLESIADRYRKKAKKLYRYNELKGRELKVGQYIFLNKKGNCYQHSNTDASTNVHIVNIGQGMYDIAQLYGIKLKRLLRYNKVYRHQEPKPGVQIFLKKQKR